MGDLTHYNVPMKGMGEDLTRFNQNANNYTFALNAVLEDRTGNGLTLQNEMSNKCNVAFPPDYRVIGFINIPEEHRTIYALVNPITGHSQIGEALDCVYKDTTDKIQPGCATCENSATSPELTAWENLPETCYCQYYTIVDAACLNFNIHYPVDIEYKITSCGVNIYFTDFLNERRYLYFDYTDFNDSHSRLKLQDQFKVILQPSTENDCTCPDGYTLNQETKQCTKTTQTQLEGCTGTIITVDGVDYCQQTIVADATCPPCTCPTGYTLNTATHQCVKVTKIPLVPTGKLRTACHVTDDSYTNFGVLIYSSFNADGSGVFENYHVNDPYWSNNNPISYTKGKLNQVALWACNPDGTQPTLYDPLEEYIGFIYPVDLPETKTYYIGIAGDNKVRIRVDCNTIVDMDANAIANEHPNGTSLDTFKYWHIYPVKISAGHHVIELTGLNHGSVAGFGAEIYNNTAQEIINSNDGTGLDILFSTKDRIGQPFQVSKTFTGACPDGSCLDIDSDGNLFCSQTSVTAVTCPPCGCPSPDYTLDATTKKCTKITQSPLGVCDGDVQTINGVRYCVKTLTIDATCEDCPPAIITDQLDCEKLKVHPNHQRPCVDFLGFVNDGVLKEGTYQILIAFADQYGNPTTEYMPASQTIPLFDSPTKFETNNQTNKAIHIRISNLSVDTPYKFYNIVVAATVDQFTTFYLADTLPVTQTNYIYTGLNASQQTLTATEVLFTRPYYELAKGVTTANNYLFYTGVNEYRTLNLQPVANSINLMWETVAIKEEAYKDPRNTFYFHTYQRDEVYAFAIIFEYNNGRNTCAFHIPGRAATPFDLDVIDNADVISDIDCNASTRNRRWQVYNTGSVLGGDYQYNEICEIDKCWEYGKFAYWESTETYPNIPQIWGDLACKPIRHHKFPDSCITHIHDGSVEERAFTDNNYIFPIGVRIDHQSVIDALNNAVDTGLITQKERDSITSYRLVRGNRVGNKSINAKGLLFNMLKYNKFDEDYYFANYAYNDLDPDDFLNGVSQAPMRYTFHSPDTHFVNTALGNILKIETEEFGKSDGYFTRSECQAKQKFLSRFAHTLAFGLGLAAALSATGAKKCKTITQKAETRVIPLTGGSVPGAIVTIPAPIPDAVMGSLLLSPNPLAAMGYERFTGLEIIPYPLASESNVTTCKGEPYQIFEDPTSMVGILLNGVAGIAGIVTQRFYLGLVEMNKVMDTMRQLIPNYNYSIQYNSIGKYNNYTCVGNGNKVRKLDKTAYLAPIIQTIDENTNNPKQPYTTIHVNNWDRESSVYLKTNTPLANPQNIDDSKVSMRSLGFEVADLDKHFNRKVVSYYASVKTNILNQYGQLCDINYIETSPCSFYLNQTYTSCQTKVFGGDTFINRFALKRKMPFFLHTMCNMPDGSDVLYKELANVATPKYWFNTPQPLFERISDLGLGTGLLSEIYDDNERSYDVQGNGHIRFYQDGVIHLFNYGIPYFLVESDINVDYRHGQNNKEKDFYPHNTNLKQWLEEANVPISEDNTYFYNRTYSKQDHESTICRSCILNIRDLLCQPQVYNRLIYSEPTDTENKYDNWLIFKANNKYDFPLTMGRLISADGIENTKVLARLEKGTQLFPAYNTIVATEQNIQVGTGGMFKNLPQDIATTTLGYAGTQNRDIKHTEYGHLWADAERGQIFNLGTDGKEMDEITKYGEKAWFKENLPFQIRKDFPNMPLDDIDNNFWGIGLHYCFDRRFNRLLVTKLDYKVLDPRIQYDPVTKNFIIPDKNPQTAYKCPPGYASSNGVCVKSTTTPATKTGSLPQFTVTPRKYFSYGIMGTFVYDEGFNTNGTGSGKLLDTSNPFWNNRYIKGQQFLDGPLNRCGFWNSNSNTPYNTWVGLTFPVNVTEEKVYYVGMAADNRGRIKIGCDNIMTFDENAMAAQAGTDIQITFKRWHVYPILLKKGVNYITLEGFNIDKEGAFGAEIYGNTFDELNAATSYADLNLIFSTSQLFTKTIDSFNYTCDNCVNPIEQNGEMVCLSTDVVNPVPYKIYHPTIIDLNDSKAFCKKGWTMSYNFYTKQWVSYHSYIPNFYVDHVDNFESGFTRQKTQHTYTHNVSNKSYQVFYGKLQPFIIEFVTKQEFSSNFLQSVEFSLDTVRYHNQYDEFYNQHLTFNKALIYNTHQTTGELNLVVTDPNNLNAKLPKASVGYNIPITNSEGLWRFNNFFDVSTAQNSNVPLFTNDCSNTHKVLNTKNIDYNKADTDRAKIRQRMCRVRLINDAISNHHFIFNFAQTNLQTSIR